MPRTQQPVGTDLAARQHLRRLTGNLTKLRTQTTQASATYPPVTYIRVSHRVTGRRIPD
jgi:hypothetical protein